jgi:hypothetical protein
MHETMHKPMQTPCARSRRDLTADSGLTFEDADEHELKAVPDRWRLSRHELIRARRFAPPRRTLRGSSDEPVERAHLFDEQLGTLILMIVGQVPFDFTGALMINLETDEVILEPTSWTRPGSAAS